LNASTTESARRRCLVFRVPMRHPGDVSGVLGLLSRNLLRADEIVAILGKTEGNGCVNDFTRAYASMALKVALAPHLGCTADEAGARIALVMSGGTEGGLSPHFLVFARTGSAGPVVPGGTKRLAVGAAFTRDLLPEELGRMTQVEATAAAVRAAIADAGITDPADVHYVQVKCPLLTSERIAEAAARGQAVVTHDTYESMGRSRGACALGVGLALGEIDPAALSEAAICTRFDLWSGRASTSAGVELMRNEIVVLGNSAGWDSEDAIAHQVMRDGIDLPAVVAALRDLGLAVGGQLDPAAASRVTAVLAKAEPSRSGGIRGARHTMWDDSDIHASRHARALVGGVLAGVIGRTELFVSGGAEHQGPDGGGPVAVIARG
jgi:cyanuric acid amidohydrolase